MPSKDDPFTNPWFDVANFLPLADGSGEQAHRFAFNSLPPELVVYVAGFLPNAAAAALALSSKKMYSLVGRRPFNMSAPEHWSLVLLLERDSDTLVACQECMKLHRPFAPIHQPRLFLPGGVTPAFSRLAAKQYIRQRPYSALLYAVNRTTIHTLSDFKLFSTVTYHMSTGNLFLRQEILIAPMTSGGKLTGRSAYLLNEIMDGKSAGVCPHVRWQHLGLELSCGTNSGSDYPSSLSASYLRKNLSRVDYLRNRLRNGGLGCQLQKMDHQRLVEFQADERYATADPGIPRQVVPNLGERFHPAPSSYDATPIPHTVLEHALAPGLKCALLHPQPCVDTSCDGLPARFRVNLVRACEICDTDMCVGAQDIASVGRVVSLTTWKNLGGVYDGGWRSWYTHYLDVKEFAGRFLVGSDDAMIIRDQRVGAAVYRAFEGILTDAPEPPVSWYNASISPQVLAAFTGTPSASEGMWWRLPGGGWNVL